MDVVRSFRTMTASFDWFRRHRLSLNRRRGPREIAAVKVRQTLPANSEGTDWWRRRGSGKDDLGYRRCFILLRSSA